MQLERRTEELAREKDAAVRNAVRWADVMAEDALEQLDGGDTRAAVNILRELLPAEAVDADPYFDRPSHRAAEDVMAKIAGAPVAPTTLAGAGRLWALDVAPDGSLLATGDSGGDIDVWRLPSCDLVTTRNVGSDGVTSIAFAPDSRRIGFGGGEGGGAGILDLDTGLIRALAGHDDAVNDIAFDRGGGRIVTASSDGSARVWDADSGAELRRLMPESGGALLGVALSPDAGVIATGGADGKARLWDAGTGKQLRVVDAHREGVRWLDFDRSGGRVVTSSDDDTAAEWEAATGRELARMSGHGGDVWDARFCPDDASVLTTSSDGTARLWDAGSGDLRRVYRGGSETLYAGRFTPDGTMIAVAGEDTALWPIEAGALVVAELDASGADDDAGAMAVRPDGGQIAAASSDGRLAIWDAATSATRVRDLQGAPFAELRYGAEGTMVTLGADEIVRVHGTDTGETLLAIESPGRTVVGVNATAAGPWALVRESGGALVVVDAATDAVMGRLAAFDGGWPGATRDARFSPDGKLVVVGFDGGLAGVWEVADGALRVRFDQPAAPLATRWSPDGRRLALALPDGTVSALDGATGAVVWSARVEPPDLLKSVSFDVEGGLLRAYLADGRIRSWAAADGQARAEITLRTSSEGSMPPLDASVDRAFFTPDGRHLALGQVLRIRVVRFLGVLLGVEVIQFAVRTRRSRGPSAGTGSGHPGGSCRTVRSRSRAA